MMNPLVLLDPEGDALAQSLQALKGSLEVRVLWVTMRSTHAWTHDP
jgi:hypothetical protein